MLLDFPENAYSVSAFAVATTNKQTNKQTNQKDNLPQALNMFLIFILLGLKT